MGRLIPGQDGLIAEEVGYWATTKIKHLCEYIHITRMVRKNFQKHGTAGTNYIDLFCGTGGCKIKGTDTWIDGSPVAAWKKSVESGAPFSKMVIADQDPDRVDAVKKRLEKLNAPVVALCGPARETVKEAVELVDRRALNFIFLDPYNLEALDFTIMQTLSSLARPDMLVHFSAMDLQRNLPANLMGEMDKFESFAPGWRTRVRDMTTQRDQRRAFFEYWAELVSQLGTGVSSRVELITHQGLSLYWLLLVAKHDLAHKFWAAVLETNSPQRSLPL